MQLRTRKNLLYKIALVGGRSMDKVIAKAIVEEPEIMQRQTVTKL